MRNVLRYLALTLYLSSFNVAASTLLWESSLINAGGIWSGGGGAVEEIVGMQFFFGYDHNSSSSTGWPFPANQVSYSGGAYLQVDEQAFGQMMGGDKYFVRGETGSFDFNAKTSPAFSAVSAMLTNGVDDQIAIGAFGFNQNRRITGGAASSGSEDSQWVYGRPNKTQQQLLGASIDFFRLNVDEVTWGTDGGSFRILGTGKWQVYGTLAVTPPALNFEPVASTSVSGSLAYNVGGASGRANESNSSPSGELVELSFVRQGYGYGTFASAEGGFLKAYAESIDTGADGSSSASASASWTDYFLITGASGTEGLEATAILTASIDGAIAGRTTEGSASFSFSVTFDPANPCLSACGLSDSTQSLAQESRSVTGRRSVSVDTVFESEFTFRYGTAFRIKAELTTSAANGGLADFGHTGTFGLTLPAGAQIVTASGLIYGPTAPIPEPSTYAMFGLGLVGVGLAMGRRRLRYAPAGGVAV